MFCLSGSCRWYSAAFSAVKNIYMLYGRCVDSVEVCLAAIVMTMLMFLCMKFQ